VAAANAAEQGVTAARDELLSGSKRVGVLLLEAKRLHPAVKDFEAFLKKVDGLKLSRAYDMLRLAGGRTTDEELKRDARERQQKSRAKKLTPDSVTEPMSRKPSAPASLPKKPEPTSPPVTESAGRVGDPILALNSNPQITPFELFALIEPALDAMSEFDVRAFSMMITQHMIDRPESGEERAA
jgi:hypothetical protein